ncbi:MAG: sulfurtransferase-like selenium metabolism protein YedF [candidate division Zixibacteria bacterium]|nr:sulfurtransferase-like selenium metabolism protein YedF [candidate division Zixibacteria bacterium]
MINHELLLMLTSSGMGEGEPDLGEKLLGAFLKSLYDSGNHPEKIICMNSGIFLTTKGTYAEEIMKKFEDAGSEVLSCGTCLDYYNRKEKLIIGQRTNMNDTVAAMVAYNKVISPR